MKHYTNNESSSTEWRADIDHLDERDPTGQYLVAPDPSFVGSVRYDKVERIISKDWLSGACDE